MPHRSLQNILYIEDDEGLARLLQRRLERHSFVVDTAMSAEEGLEKIQHFKFDLILLDYNLPGMSGLEMLDLLKSRESAPPIIILTASGDERLAVAALERGAVDYAVKDTGQNYFDLLPAIMQAAFTREALLKENQIQRTQLLEARDKAEAANEAKSNFLATMSHEIRTPMNVVIGLTNVLEKTNLDEKQRKIVSTLNTNAELLLKLINDLLDISRIESGQVVLESTPFTFGSILENTKQMFEQQAKQKVIAMEILDKTNGQSFLGDRTRVQQIVMNLVSNAIKFTSEGKVEIVAEYFPSSSTGGTVALRVSDTGIGIEPEKLPMIFDKFTQADATITRRFGGSGLGLSIAHSLAKLMGGTITTHSVHHEGSVFTAHLNLETAAEIKTASQPSPVASPEGDPSRSKEVLLVEDYAPNIMVATMMLEDMGYVVTSAESGEQALKIIETRTSPFWAILMDVQMYDMDGLQTTKHIRAMEREKNMRHTIIGVTAHALAGDRERCIDAGMDDYVSKPIHPEILANKLRLCA